MNIEFLLEEESAEAALHNLLPKILPSNVTFRFHNFRGKQNLLAQLPKRLRGYNQWLPSDWRIVVLVDEDREDCKLLKARLEKMASDAGLQIKSQSRNFQILNRIAVEELEAWFFGDIVALNAAYPKTPITLSHQKNYRKPDAIKGGTWEALERVLQTAGYYLGGLPKIEVARNVSQYMEPERNRSRSFQVFKEGLLEIIRT